jgi:outer membrane protein assembly factor BamB
MRGVGVLQPIVIGGVVLAATPEGYLKGVSRATGEPLWEWDQTDTLVAKDEERLYLLGSHKIYALDVQTGERLWRIETDGQVATKHYWVRDSPITPVLDGTFYFFELHEDNTVTFAAIDSSSGERRWLRPLDSDEVVRILPGVVLVSRSASFVDKPHTLGLDARTGEVMWHSEEWGLSLRDGYCIELDDTLVATATFADEGRPSELTAIDTRKGTRSWGLEAQLSELSPYDDVVFVLRDGKSVNLSDGTVRWTWKSGTMNAPIGVVDDTVLFSSESRDAVYGLSLHDGSELWVVDLEGPHTSLAASEDVAVVAGAFRGLEPTAVYGIQTRSGERIWSVQRDLGRPHVTQPFVVTDSGLLLASADSVELFNPETGEIIWQRTMSGLVRSVVESDDLVLILAGWGSPPLVLDAYQESR